jgi:TonB family protein
VFGAVALLMASGSTAAQTSADATGAPTAPPARLIEIVGDVHNEHVAIWPDSPAQLVFRDGSTLTVGPGSDLTIDHFVYGGDAKNVKLAVTAATGVFHFVSGRETKDDAIAINTPTATIRLGGGINFTTVVGDIGETATTQIVGKQTTAISKSTGESQALSRNGFTMSITPNAPITIKRMNPDTSRQMLAVLPSKPGASAAGGMAQRSDREFRDGLPSPIVKDAIRPEYPEEARKKQLEGTVIVRARVAPDGRPESVFVFKSSDHSVLDRAARDAVARWRFAVRDRAVTVNVPIVFKIKREFEKEGPPPNLKVERLGERPEPELK